MNSLGKKKKKPNWTKMERKTKMTAELTYILTCQTKRKEKEYNTIYVTIVDFIRTAHMVLTR